MPRGLPRGISEKKYGSQPAPGRGRSPVKKKKANKFAIYNASRVRLRPISVQRS
jgi:hypothetical protein